MMASFVDFFSNTLPRAFRSRRLSGSNLEVSEGAIGIMCTWCKPKLLLRIPHQVPGRPSMIPASYTGRRARGYVRAYGNVEGYAVLLLPFPRLGFSTTVFIIICMWISYYILVTSVIAAYTGLGISCFRSTHATLQNFHKWTSWESQN